MSNGEKWYESTQRQMHRSMSFPNNDISEEENISQTLAFPDEIERKQRSVENVQSRASYLRES